jgi:hypothetical protein
VGFAIASASSFTGAGLFFLCNEGDMLVGLYSEV